MSICRAEARLDIFAETLAKARYAHCVSKRVRLPRKVGRETNANFLLLKLNFSDKYVKIYINDRAEALLRRGKETDREQE